LLGCRACGVGDGDEEVLAGEDVDGGEDGHLLAGVVGVGLEADRFEDSEGVVRGCVDLDALVCAAGVFDVERVEVVLAGELVEFGVVGVVELIPGHGGSSGVLTVISPAVECLVSAWVNAVVVVIIIDPTEAATVACPGFGATRQRKREEVKRGECSLAALALPDDIGRGAAGAARLLEAGLVWDGDCVGNRLREDGLGCFYIRCCNLKANTADKVGDLPVETDEVLVFEEAEDACRLDDGTGDECL
jgi:hypothetical protein